MNYRLGLDIGIASIGWSVMEVNYDGEPTQINRLGVRVFEKAETDVKGESPAMARRLARGARRRLRRRALRLITAKKIFAETIADTTEDFSIIGCDIYALRAKALDELIEEREFAAIILNIIKHRGFKSNRKSESTQKETSVLLGAISGNSTYRKEKGYRTVGEMYARDDRFVKNINGVPQYHIRNKLDLYDKTIAQDDLHEEIELLFKAQREFGNKIANTDIEEKILKIFSARREFDEGPGYPSPYKKSFEVGKCVFEKDEKRAPKASYTFEYTNMLIKLNNLRLKCLGEERALSASEKKTVLKYVFESKSGELTYKQLKSILNIDKDTKFNALTYTDSKNHAYKLLKNIKLKTEQEERFLSSEEKGKIFNALMDKGELSQQEILNILGLTNFELILINKKDNKKEFNIKLKNVEESKFISMYKCNRIINALESSHKSDIDLIDEIALLLSMNKSDSKIKNEIKENKNLSQLTNEEIENLLTLSFSGFGSISIKALKKIQPYILQGMRYDEACAAVGYNFRAHQVDIKNKLLNTKEIREIVNEIKVPVVRRAISQTIKIINAIVREFGSPAAVNVELARELSKTFEERINIKNKNQERAEENQKIFDYIQQTFNIVPKGIDIVKYRLYEEQYGKCAYSQVPIDAQRLFDPTYLQIDHIIPYSRSFNDSYNNKALVLLEENQNKKNMLPYEYFGADIEKWDSFVNFVKATYKSNPTKIDIMLRKTFTKENEKEWQERSLNDTKHISKFVFNLINDYLLLNENIKCGKKRVTAVNGAVTSYLRKMWGIEKIRTDGDLHHAKDATIVACVTDGMIQAVTSYNKGKEMIFKGSGTYTDMVTGEILTRDDYDRLYGGGDRLKQPYNGFAKELDLRLQPDIEENREAFLKLGYEWEDIDTTKPVFVSRMPTRKAKGRMHMDTIRSAKALEDGFVITKKDIKELKLNKDGEIEGYYRKEDDRLLYEALRTRLAAFGGDGKKAFEMGFSKPKSDGTAGNPVKKVKIQEKSTLEVKLDKIKGAAGNASIVRTDIFYKDKKYYAVPVYVSDVYKGELPNRAIEAYKPREKWPVMDENYEFLFSLFPNDLIYIEHKKGFSLEKNDGSKKKIVTTKEHLYYRGINISVGSISVDMHDDSYSAGSLGLKTLQLIKKCSVDMLGNISIVGHEPRMPVGMK